MAFQEEMLSKVLSNAGRGIRKKKQKKNDLKVLR